MSQLLWSTIPGFFDLADASLAGGLTLDGITKISHTAKAAAVRCEVFFMGFYGPGDTVATPTSPVDGYAYSYAECLFIPILYSSRSPAAGYTPGQATRPALANNDGGTGNLIVVPYAMDVNDANGQVTMQTYWSSSGAENQGTVKVLCMAQRLSVNLPAGVSGD